MDKLTYNEKKFIIHELKNVIYDYKDHIKSGEDARQFVQSIKMMERIIKKLEQR